MKRIPALALWLLATLSAAFCEEGLASWYGGKFQGRRTASGEIFDTNRFTAAHRTLAFGTLVRVTNLDNGRSTTVRINDRGPFVAGRIIDLSRAAAQAIGMTGAGVARVRVEVVSPASQALYSVQVGAFRDRRNAAALLGRLRRQGLAGELRQAGGIVRVLLSNVPEADLADLLGRLAATGLREPLVQLQP